MSLHDSDLKSRLVRFLGRKQMPRRFEGKPLAMDDEIAALAGILARSAPRNAEALAVWWPIFEAVLGEVCGSMWPTEKEVRDAVRQCAKDMPRQASTGPSVDMSDLAVTARKMQRGEPVGEAWLWGRNAVELATSGLIDAGTMRDYRSRAFLRRKDTYGEDEALKWEAEAKQRHEDAKAVWRQRGAEPGHHDTSVPDKSVHFPKDFAA